MFISDTKTDSEVTDLGTRTSTPNQEEVPTLTKSQSEIFTLQNLTHALSLVYGNHPRFNEDFLKGMVILYNTNNTRRNIWEICESPFLKETVEAMANTGALPEILMESKHSGYMMVHFLLAISDDADMVPLLTVLPPLLNGEKDEEMKAMLADSASALIWRSTRTGINLLHAAAMNNHHQAAVNVATILLAHCTEEQLFQTDSLGLLPVHYAVINGNVELVRILREKMATFESQATAETEPMTIFPVSSFVLENLLANHKTLDDVRGTRCLENRPAKWAERSGLTDDEISEADGYLRRGGELVAGNKLRAILSSQGFLRCTPFGKALLNEMSMEKDLTPLRASVMDGLLEPLTPVLHTWNKFHAAAISTTTTVKKLTEMVNADASGLFEADAHGRPPLFYAVAYAKAPVAKWFLEQYATHHQKIVGEDVLGIDLYIAAYCNSKGTVTDGVKKLLDEQFKNSKWEVQPGDRPHGRFLELGADDFSVLNPGCHRGLSVAKKAKDDYSKYPAYGHQIVWPFLHAIAQAAGNNAVRRYIADNPFEWDDTEHTREFSAVFRRELGEMKRNLIRWELKGCY